MDQVFFDNLMAIIPHIPIIINASKSVWELMIKPLLKNNDYPISNELEQKILTMEKNNDIVGIIDSIEKLAQSIKSNNISLNNTGDYVQQMVFNNNGDVYLGKQTSINNKNMTLYNIEKEIISKIKNDAEHQLLKRGNIASVQGYFYQIGSETLPINKTGVEFAHFEDAMKNLIKYELLEKDNRRRDCWKLTSKGWDFKL
jgi:hypothetical protein